MSRLYSVLVCISLLSPLAHPAQGAIGWSRDAQVLGRTNLIFVNLENGVRLSCIQETNAGDFAADALYWFWDSQGADVDTAIVTGGSIQGGPFTGELTRLDCQLIQPLGSSACLQTVTGRQLLDALAWGARFADRNGWGGFLQVSGITYEIDTTQPDPTVHSVQVYQKETGTWYPLEPERQYHLALYSDILDSGYGFSMLQNADWKHTGYVTAPEVLAKYILGFPDGVIASTNAPLSEKYPGLLLDYTSSGGSGRIGYGAAPQQATQESVAPSEAHTEPPTHTAPASDADHGSSAPALICGFLLVAAAVIWMLTRKR